PDLRTFVVASVRGRAPPEKAPPFAANSRIATDSPTRSCARGECCSYTNPRQWQLHRRQMVRQSKERQRERVRDSEWPRRAALAGKESEMRPPPPPQGIHFDAARNN